MKSISIRDLRQRWPAAEALLQVEKEIVITRDAKPIARLVRIDAVARSQASASLVDNGAGGGDSEAEEGSDGELESSASGRRRRGRRGGRNRSRPSEEAKTDG